MKYSSIFQAIVASASVVLMANVEAAEQVTYSKDVAPIFFEHCAMCHRPGEVAPMSLLSYQEARPWAKSIAKAVGQRVMPPWSGESENRTWKNDISLSQEQIDTILAWVAQGAKRGNPTDMPNAPTFPTGWTLGEPDYVITLDAVEVPAAGEDLFLKQWTTLDIDETKWVNAIEFIPGDRRATHHIQTTYNNAGSAQIGAKSAAGTGVLAIWTAGMPPFTFPEGVGRVIGPQTKVLIDSHYHPFGEATTDRTKIGLHFGEGELKKQVATMIVSNTGMRIPPGAPHHAEVGFSVFDRDMQILAFSPHLHLRGKAMRYDLIYPDGERETLLNVPKYNYNWQWQYYPTEPIDVPAGSTLEVTAVWDNSADNPFNPDPTQEIIYRGNVFNEMFVGFFEAIPKEGVYHDPKPAKVQLLNLLAAHPPEDSYFVGGFIPMGLYLPSEGEGWLYLVQGVNMFTITLDDIQWDGDHLVVTTQLPTREASATLSIIEGDRDNDGRIKGEFRYGIDSPAPLTMPMIAQPMTSLRDKTAQR